MKTIKLEDKVIYQIFPRSFYDSNNDGDGDLKGITLKLDYLQDLGINAIWLCPIYKTNFVDAGYDVLDYKSVWKQFGTLEDFKELTQEAKKRNIDIIMDIVLNHVSNEHEWFKKACESVENVEHNYFIWREKLSEVEAKATSIFGGNAWEYVPSVNKYYFHLFAKEQVDLNWNHPDTINAISDVIQFWYDLGVRGFRLDAIKHVAKDFKTVENNPAFAWCDGAVEALRKFNEIAFSDKPDAYVLGESSGISYEELLKYADGPDKVADNYFNFAWWWIGWGRKTGRNGYDANWNYHEFVYQQKPFQESTKVKPHMITNFLSNHDTSRSVSRWGNETFFRSQSAKTHALFLMMLKGVPCIYYGEEIGMLNTEFNARNEFKDVDTYNAFENFVDKEKIYSESEMLLYSNINSRDAGRVIMQWNDQINFGFNKGEETWIKLGRNGSEINVENDLKNANSILNFYKKIIKMRKVDFHDLIVYGEAKIELQNDGSILLTRFAQDTNKVLKVLINMTNKELNLEQEIDGNQILSSYEDNKLVTNVLRPYESILLIKE
ncbi:sucrase-isomaltase [Mycoplasmopsis pullorum]|uniref:alpha-amylase family glycosyl hydrolase n=1 Tax=Mycoplasmopsis pullorum TaxID=48003 RepID=UPI00111B6FB7|nr:alpha-amylase family glycosyl hydrolase [Mycoplasmopsis pullorum]TNK83670.1 sucrase-isomaltase [Mycoplasmopsis pullorum]TNK92147.1 sucrase-isomaltase [Mycoplasmopsis pullorum]